MSFSRSIPQPAVTAFHGRSRENIDDFLCEIRLSFAHIKDAYTDDEDKEAAHIQLIKSNCSGKAARYIRSLPSKQKTTAANLISALKSAFDNTSEEDAREVEAHRAMLELKQKKGEDPAKYARRARRIAEYIDPKYNHLLTLKFRDGFQSRTMQMHLSADSDAPDKFTFETVYKRFLNFNKINQKKSKKKRQSEDFSSSESESDSESDSEIPKGKKKLAVGSGYDTDESSSSSDDKQARKKKNRRNPKKADRKNPLKVMEELKELLSSKSSSEMPGVDLRALKDPKSPLDSFEVSPATTQERASGNTDEQKVTI